MSGGLTLEERLALAPDDLELRIVYGDWLAANGDRSGAFIAAACELARLAESDPAREERSRIVASLWEESREAWNRRFNAPYTLLDDREIPARGLPEVAVIEGRELDPTLLDAQLARLPVTSLVFRGMRLRDLTALSELGALRRVTSLAFVAPKHPLGGHFVRWLANLNLAQLRTLRLERAGFGVRELDALLDALPALERLEYPGLDETVADRLYERRMHPPDTTFLDEFQALSAALDQQEVLQNESVRVRRFPRDSSSVSVVQADGNADQDRFQALLAPSLRQELVAWEAAHHTDWRLQLESVEERELIGSTASVVRGVAKTTSASLTPAQRALLEERLDLGLRSTIRNMPTFSVASNYSFTCCGSAVYLVERPAEWLVIQLYQFC